jgi:hypothetical protein
MLSVAQDERIQELWLKAAGIDSIPRVLLIDHEGILRDPPGTLEEKVAKLLATLSEKSPANEKR